MPSFGKKVKEESINDKMVRLFKEGKSVHDISMELEVKEDVITNVIRRRCGEDSIPDTVIRSKNALPHSEEAPLKADAPTPSASTAEEPQESAEAATEGMSKLERLMLEKEKKRQEQAAAAAAAEEAAPEEDEATMEGISTEGLVFDDYPAASEPAPAENEAAAEEEVEMDGIKPEEIPVIAENEVIEEKPVAAYEAPVEEAPAAEPESAPIPAAETAVHTDAEAVSVDVPTGSSAFDKMKAFAMAQVAANNEKLSALESKLSSVESDYTSQLEEAEKNVAAANTAYEDVLNRGDALADKRTQLQAEHRAALARADEEYRRKLDEIETQYNDANAAANSDYAAKEAELNAEDDKLSVEKENAKNNFLTCQAAVNDVKGKIATEVDAVKAQINAIKEENAGYEPFLK